MKTNHKKATLIILILSLILPVCLWIAIEPPCPELTQINTDKPDFVDKVWPPPDTEITFACYNRRTWAEISNFPPPPTYPHSYLEPEAGVAIKIKPELIVEEMEDYPNFSKRISLKVDGIRRFIKVRDDLDLTYLARSEDEMERFGQTPGWYYFGSWPILFPGEHTARFEILKIDGEKLVYEWHFTITWW